MSNQFNSDEEVLARLVREAGDPSVSPDPQYAETLRATILDRVGPAETVAHVTEAIRKADVIPITVERTRKMKRIAKFAVAATILVAVGISGLLDDDRRRLDQHRLRRRRQGLGQPAKRHLRLHDGNEEPGGREDDHHHDEGFFLAPSRERVEMSMSTGSAKDKGSSIMILDRQAMKGLTLVPEQKLAIMIDLSKIEKPAGPSNMFEMVRQLVREGSSSPGEKVESLGKKEIDGRVAVGFRTHGNMADMTFWADPQTARLVRSRSRLRRRQRSWRHEQLPL